jgi:hypothetical protein
MPRSSRALLPAEIRSRLEVRARADALMGFLALPGTLPGLARTGGPAPTPRSAPATNGRSGHAGPRRDSGGRSRRTDRHPKSYHQDLSPGSPDDSSVLSDFSDRK